MALGIVVVVVAVEAALIKIARAMKEAEAGTVPGKCSKYTE